MRKNDVVHLEDKYGKEPKFFIGLITETVHREFKPYIPDIIVRIDDSLPFSAYRDEVTVIGRI